MWAECKSLRSLLLDVYCNGRENKLLVLENSLAQHKELFLSPLTCKGKDADHRTAVKNAIHEAITLPDIQQCICLTHDFVDEVLILSDLFEMDELAVLDLLLTAESQLPSYPHLTRGLLAVLLYFDMHDTVVNSLLTLIQARDGRTWSPTISSELIRLADTFTEELWANGLLNNILRALGTFSSQNELIRLDNLQAIGSPKHKYEVYNLLTSIENGLSECVLLWSCQSAFTVAECKLILDHLLTAFSQSADSKQFLRESSEATNQCVESQWMELTHAHTHLFMALLYTLEPFAVSSDAADHLNELTDLEFIHPLFADRVFASDFSTLLESQKDKINNTLSNVDSTEHLAMLSLLRLAWAICLRRSAPLRSDLFRGDRGCTTQSPTASPNPKGTENSADVSRSTGANGFGVEEDDEQHANTALESGALEFLRKRLLVVPDFEREPLWVYRVHGLITDLLVCMPTRVREIRSRDEDLYRRTGFDPSSNGSGFANLFLLIGQLYNQPGSKLHARLALDYWWPSGEVVGSLGVYQEPIGQNLTEFLLSSRSPSKSKQLHTAIRLPESQSARQASLFRFVRSVGDMATTAHLFIPYLHMLRGLVQSKSAASLCFSMLKSNANNAGRSAALVSLDHFFASFAQYLDHMKQPQMPLKSNTHAQLTSRSPFDDGHGLIHAYPYLYHDGSRSSVQQLGNGNVTPKTAAGLVPRCIQPTEQAGLQTVLRLITRIARMDPLARSVFISNPNWQLLPILLGLLTCPIPPGLKAELLYLLSSLSRTPNTATLVWRHLTSAELLPILQQKLSSNLPISCGLHTEMDEVEPRMEEYQITRAFLSLISVLIPQLPMNLDASIELHDPSSQSAQDCQSQTNVSLVSFVLNTIFLKHTMRAYRDPSERWEISASCLVLFDGLIDQFIMRLDAATAAVNLTGIPPDSNRSTLDKFSTFNPGKFPGDWAALLIDSLWELKCGSKGGSLSHVRPAVELLMKLRIPVGWPHIDPGYLLVTQILSDSSLFRTLTGMLELALHRMLEFPLPLGPPSGMIRATAAALRMIQRVLTNEDILLSFIRCATVGPSFSTHLIGASKPFAILTSNIGNTLPTRLSRLLMSVNSRTGRPDFLSMLLRYTSLSGQLPDHCSSSINILASLIELIKPHSDLLALLIADQDIAGQLLQTSASFLDWTVQNVSFCGDTLDWPVVKTDSEITNTHDLCFTDEWLLSNQAESLTCLGSAALQLPHPSTDAARMLGSLPCQSPNWQFPSHDWELFTVWPQLRQPWLNPSSSMDGGQWGSYSPLRKDQLASVPTRCFDYLMENTSSKPIMAVKLLHILLSCLDKPAPNLAHWLLGFRVDSVQALSNTTLQDAGIANQPQTCLHTLLDLINTGIRFKHNLGSLPKQVAVVMQWELAISWQIIYKLASNPLTSASIIRYLRSNHDLIAKYLQLGLKNDFDQSEPPQCQSSPTDSLMSILTWNTENWFLRTMVLDLRTASSTRQQSYMSMLFKLLFGDLLKSGSDLEFSGSQSQLGMFLSRLKICEPIDGPESFELRSFDAKIIEEILNDCEFVVPLINSDSAAVRKAATLVDRRLLLNRTYLKLLSAHQFNSSPCDNHLIDLFVLAQQRKLGDQSSLDHSTAMTNLVTDLMHLDRWVDARNLHRLSLYVGKQAAFEAWRQVVEIGCGLLVSHIHSVLPSVPPTTLSTIDHDDGFSPIHPCPRIVYLRILHTLLVELTVKDGPPSTIRLLASGTLLHLSSFVVSPRHKNGIDERIRMQPQLSSLLSQTVYLLVVVTMQTKTAAQRVRANLYGALSCLLHFAQQLRKVTKHELSNSTSTHLALSECLSAITAASKTHTSHWSQSELMMASRSHVTALQSDASALHSLLVWDLLRSHAVTQMGVISLLNILLTTDHCSRDLCSLISKQFVVQQLLDSITEDLYCIETFTLSPQAGLADSSQQQQHEDSGSTDLVSTVTTAFHLYQSKVSLLCRLSVFPTAAKVFLQNDVVNTLAGCSIFSASTLANCYKDCVDAVGAAANSSGEISQDSLTRMISSITTVSEGLPELDADSVLHRIVHSLSTDSPLLADGSISWSGILIPTVRLLKMILTTLGPTHMGANQQVYNFIYTHSNALLTDDMDLDSILVDYLNNTSSVVCQSYQNTLGMWAADQISLTELFVLVSRSRSIMGRGDEYSNLQHHVVESRLIRYALASLSSLVLEPLDHSRLAKSGSLNHSLLLCETQQLLFVRQLLSICIAGISSSLSLTPDAAPTSSLIVRSLHKLVHQTSTVGSPFNGLHLLSNLVSWTVTKLASLEELSLSIVNLGLLHERNDVIDASKGRNSMFFNSLKPHGTLLGEKCSVEDLRQASSLLFNYSSTLSGSIFESNLEGPGREIAHLRTIVSVGLSLIRLQLMSLIAISQQATYLMWVCLDAEAKTMGPIVNVPSTDTPHRIPPRRLQETQPKCKPDPMTPRSKAELSRDQGKTHLLRTDQLQALLNMDFLNQIDRLAKAPYLEARQQLFLQAIHHRLERLCSVSSTT